MSYVKSVLMPNEEVVTLAKTHWFIYVVPSLWLIFSILSLALLFYAQYTLIPGFFLLAIAAFLFFKAWLYAYSTELAVTSKRVIAKFGFIRRNTVELKHSKVESVHVNQSIIGRIFNYGSIRVTGSGGTSAPIPYIADPLKFRSAALTTDEE